MTVITQHLNLRVECDKPACDAKLHLPDPHLQCYQQEFHDLIRRNGWRMWVGRSRRYYCPDHGPSRPDTMREITR